MIKMWNYFYWRGILLMLLEETNRNLSHVSETERGKMFNIIVDWEKMKKCSKEEKEELLRYIESLLEVRRNFNKK